MADPKSIINLGLGKIAASRVSSITPPKSPIERHCADGYPMWRDDELSKRAWYFALETATLTQESDSADAGDGRKYKYALPNDNMRVLRSKWTEWEQRGKYLYSACSTLTISYVKRPPEGEFIAPFVNVLAGRVAMECVEYATQSNTKAANVKQLHYDPAVADAGKVNAFVIGPEDVSLADENSEWITARWGVCP